MLIRSGMRGFAMRPAPAPTQVRLHFVRQIMFNTKRIGAIVVALAGLSASCFSQAQSAPVSVSAPWIRATVPAQKTAGAFMQLTSTRPLRLVGVSSPVAGRTEIHQMEMQGQTMRMHAVDGIDIPANHPVNLASGGYHIMLFELQRQLKEGEQVPLTLRFVDPDRKQENVTVQVPVKPLGYTAPAPARH
jgi:copper(I)-binding protein